jgi:polysaccharide export outer membrane protein
MKSLKTCFVSYCFILFILVLSAPVAIAENKYVIGDEDMLQISIWGSPELTVHVPVRPDGMISVPLIGDMKASGLTPQELKVRMENEMARFVKAPTVSVIVTAVNSFKVFVLGSGISRSTDAASVAVSGAASGAISLKRNTTLLQLLAQLGSLQNVDLKKSFLLRSGKKLNVDFHKLVILGDVPQDLQLVADDIVFLADNYENRVMVIGAVRTPSVLQYREGMTTFDAIIGAGGFTEFGNPNDVVIVRKTANGSKNIEVKLKDVIKRGDIRSDLPLEPGDRVIVKTGIF